MKKGMEVLGAEFVLDEFHIQKYIRSLLEKWREHAGTGKTAERGRSRRKGRR